MKKINLLIIGLILTTTIMAQSSDWTKEDRNKLYEEAMNITAKYKNLSEDQKSTISLCYLNEVTKKYTKKELDSKISIEIERIQEATITTCAKNIGVDLNEAPKSSGNNEIKLSKEALLGQWYSEEFGAITFNEDNTFKRQNDCSSTYIVTTNGVTLSKVVGKGMMCGTFTFKMVKFTSSEMILFDRSTNYTFKKVQ